MCKGDMQREKQKGKESKDNGNFELYWLILIK